MEFDKSPAGRAPLAAERQAFASMLAGDGLAQALSALLRAFEQETPGVAVAVHAGPRPDGMTPRVFCGPALAAFCTRVGELPQDQSPVLQAAASLQSVWVDDTPTAGADAAPWVSCRSLMREHGVRRCRFEPLLDASRSLAVGVLACHELEPGLAREAGLAGLAQAAALLVNHDLRMRRREHEGRQRRETLRMLAHDLRNLIAPLRTALEVLARPQADLQALQRLRSIMVRQVAQLAALPDEIGRLACSEGDGAMPDGDSAQLTLPTGDAQGGGHKSSAPSALPGVASGRRLPVGPEPARARPRVLVADDNEHVRRSFEELLAAEGFEVRSVADGEQAVEIADEWEPDVVLLDIHMPRLSGIEAARRLRATHPPPRMALLMLSGMTLNDAWVRHAKAAGFDDCLDKSADPQAWLARVRQCAMR